MHYLSLADHKTQSPPKEQQHRQRKHPIIDEESVANNAKSPTREEAPPLKHNTSSFASIFEASLENTIDTSTAGKVAQNPASRTQSSPHFSVSSGISSVMSQLKQTHDDIAAPPPSVPTKNERVIPTIVTEEQQLARKHVDNNDDDEDHIDWASSDDEEEEIQKEMATFERSQVCLPETGLVFFLCLRFKLELPLNVTQWLFPSVLFYRKCKFKPDVIYMILYTNDKNKNIQMAFCRAVRPV